MLRNKIIAFDRYDYPHIANYLNNHGCRWCSKQPLSGEQSDIRASGEYIAMRIREDKECEYVARDNINAAIAAMKGYYPDCEYIDIHSIMCTGSLINHDQLMSIL